MTDVTPAYGSHALGPWRRRFLRLAQAMPPSWLGRRGALVARRLALLGWQGPIDGEAEGHRLRVHLHDNVSERKFLFMPQFVDPAERAHVRAVLAAQGGVFLDIGANAGIYSLTAAAALPAGGRVLSFEPNPTMLERLRTNIALNGFEDRVRVLPLALSDRAGEIEFTVSDSNLGESGLAGGSGRRIRVPCDTLHQVLVREGVARVTGMKIDVEGLEDRILMPFLAAVPADLYPGFIIIENSQGVWSQDLLGEFVRRGYRLAQQCKMNSIYVRS